MRKLTAVTLLLAALIAAGCGGQGPQFGSGTGESSFGFGSSTSSVASGANKLAAGFWGLDTLKRPIQVEELSATAEKAGDVQIAVKEISYDGERWEGSPTKIFAYLAYPVKDKGVKLPAVVHVHGAEQTASVEFVKDWASRGYAALSLDLPGHGPGRESSRSTGPDMTEENIFESAQSAKESWLFPATCSVLRGVTVLANQPMVDPFRIGVVGYGWGGVIALIANGVDNRIRAACSVYGCGYVAENGRWAGQMRKTPAKQRKAWIDAYDPSSYAKSQNGPVLYLTAAGETDYPLACFLKTVKGASGEKRCAVTPNGKTLDDTASGDILLWFNWALRSGSGFPKVQTQVKVNKLTVTAKGGRPVVKAVLYHKADSDNKWTGFEGKPENGVCSFALPIDVPSLSYFVSVIDDQGGVVSTEVAVYRSKDVKTASNRR